MTHVNHVLERASQSVTGKMLKMGYYAGYYQDLCGDYDGFYQDLGGNSCCFDKTISDSITIRFLGKNNKVIIGHNVIHNVIASNNELLIILGNNGICSIGNETHIGGGRFCVSEARLIIGAECLFSSQILIRNHDGHHIFDVNTHKRINYSKDIIIGNHVWVGWGASFLGGTQIGNGSIVGARAVTSSKFGEHQIIAGSPARVIRENVCWSIDSTGLFNRDTLEECIHQEAFKYL